jgi:prolipoprotein diacylglyceryltransferase
MYKRELPMLPVYSLGAIYAPLIHGIARIGCFLIGCCHGCPTNAAWGITYTDPLSHAPLNIPLHPTQLYSSLFYFALFFLLRYCIAPRTKLYGPTDTSTLPPLTHAVATEVAMAVQAECIACHAEAESEGGRGAHHTIFNEITLITAYLMGMSLERFINDFFRGDRITDAHGPLSVLSFHQWTALSIFTCTLLFFLYSRVRKTHIPHAQ